MFEKLKAHISYTVILILIASLCLMGGILIHHPPEKYGIDEIAKLLAHFLTEAGIAFIIAIIVIHTIERRQRTEQDDFYQKSIKKQETFHEEANSNRDKYQKKLLDSVSKKLFSTIYKKNIPEETFKGIFEVIDNCKVFRTDHCIYFSIQAPGIEGLEKYVLCELSSRYYFENVTDTDITQDVVLFIEKPLDESVSTYCFIEYIKIDGVIVKDEPCTSTEYVDSAHSTTFRHNIPIAKGQKILVETKAQTIKLRNDIEIWSLVHISDGVTVNVDWEPSLNIEVNASAKHSKPLKPLRNNKRNKSWELKHGTFPHQSVLIWWKDSNPALQNDTDDQLTG